MQRISVFKACLKVVKVYQKVSTWKGVPVYYVGPVDAVGDEAVGPAGLQQRLLSVWISSPTDVRRNRHYGHDW
ncbi:hypothetical protein O9992_16980 [Vibrio lentus]|nr:hypothetical protein [Vibrio lentus]